MKSSISLFAFLAACNVVTACGGVAPDDIRTDQAALLGVEPDEIDNECSAAEYDAAGRITKVTCPDAAEGAAKPKPSGNTIYVGGASGGVWKTTTTEGAPEKKLVTYGPVITIKPKG